VSEDYPVFAPWPSKLQDFLARHARYATAIGHPLNFKPLNFELLKRGTFPLPGKTAGAMHMRLQFIALMFYARLKFGFFSALVCLLTLNLHASENGLKYFRSDHGLADPSVGNLPSDLDAPGALRWRVPMDPGHSTPIVSGGKIFLTTYQTDSRELAVLALDEKTGRTLWRNAINVERVEQTHPIGSPATATPACDGRRLYAFFGSYGLLAFDLDGKKLWEYHAGPFRDEYGAGSSPILFDGKIILNEDHDVDSFLLAIDAATGKPLWKTPRPDAVRSYSTPVVWSHNGRNELLVAGALELAGYDPTDGKKLWWINGLARIVIPTPAPLGDTVYMASWAPGGDAARRIAFDSWPVALSKWDANHDGKLSKAEIKDAEVLDRFSDGLEPGRPARPAGMGAARRGISPRAKFAARHQTFRFGRTRGERRCVETHARRALCHDAGA
jgi:hypothetical protein